MTVLTCPNCAYPVPAERATCPSCGTAVEEQMSSAPTPDETTATVSPSRHTRYPALRAIVVLIKVCAVVWPVFWVAAAVFAPEAAAPAKGRFLILGSVLVGALGCLSLWAYAEGIIVVLDIEQNTRRAASYLVAGSKSEM